MSYTAYLMGVSGGSWLGINGSTSGTTPTNLYLEYNPTAVTAPGTYTGTLVITSPTFAFTQFSIPITLTVTTSTTVTVLPASLTFAEAVGGSLPAAQALSLTSTPGPATYTTAITYSQGTNWLQVTPTSGNTNSSVQVSVAANTLSQGSYQAQISFAFQDSATTSVLVSVTLNVGPAQTVTTSPSSLNFAYQIGGKLPPAQPLSVAAAPAPRWPSPSAPPPADGFP